MMKLDLLKHVKNCVVIGTTSLCISILEQLIDKNWNIICVISDDELVKRYCKSRNLKLSPKLNEINECDFILFSIANYKKICSEFLKNRRVKLAINYHDSLLPKYAGINSTTWAIYNKEALHGITWHLISDKIDEGDIISQSIIPIDNNETAFSLNLKCFNEAIKAFELILEDIEKGSFKVTKQNKTEKSYYGKDFLPINYGIINLNDNFEAIERLYRSLYFGSENYKNSVASLKIWNEGKLYLVKEIDFINCINAIPGYVYSTTDSSLIIGIKNGKLIIKNLISEEGAPVSIENSGFKKNSIVPSLILNQDELNILSQVKSRETKALKVLKNKDSPFFYNEINKKDSYKYKKRINYKSLKQSEALQLISLVILKFIRSTIDFSIKKKCPFKSGFLNHFVKEESFISINSNQLNLSYEDFGKLIQSQYNECYLIPKDLHYRYHIDPPTKDVEIVFASKNKSSSSSDHRLSIIIDKSNIYIHGYEQDKLILDSFSSSLEFIFKNSTISPDTKLFDILIHSSEEQVNVANASALTLEKNDIIERFEERVLLTPNAIAVSFNEKEISYKTLHGMVNAFSNELFSLGSRKETLIALGMERSLELVVSILAVMKTGAAYLPLDPDYPEDRLNFMLQDSDAKILITQRSLREKFRFYKKKKVFLDEPKEEDKLLFPSDLDPNRLAYVIYTSGSSGKPKGVEITHKSLNNLLAAMQEKLMISPKDRWLALTTISFDISILELLLPIIQGATIVLLDQISSKDPNFIIKAIHKKLITVVQATPSMWQMIVDLEWRGRKNLTILCGGEALPLKLAKILKRKCRTLWNMYGPTETTIWSSMKKIEDDIVTIGKPIANTTLYILDESHNVLPIGVPGELYIGGYGLARGYINRPELIEERFIQSPFDNSLSGKLYKTGDLARYLPNGEIEYLGRIDLQVKHLGFRIELGEIEETIKKFPGIDQVIVCLQEDRLREKRLIAYYKGTINEVELRQFLCLYLPDQMIPCFFVNLAEFPLTPNGKIDRKALPSPKNTLNAFDYIAPQTKIEIEVAKIFEKLLDIEKVSVNSNFFSLGGHSLLAARIIANINKLFHINLPLNLLFENSTVYLISNEIEIALKGYDKLPIQRTPDTKITGLSPAQGRFWFLDQQIKNSAAYSIPFLLEFTGKLDVHLLKDALEKIVGRHEILRAIFRMGSEIPEQFVLNNISDFIQYIELSDEKEIKNLISKESKKPFDLTSGPLFRFFLIRSGINRHLLFLNFHHIIFDAQSIHIFIRELGTIYSADKNASNPSLPALDIQYKDYVHWQSQAPGKDLEKQVSWWKEKLQNAPSFLKLPIDMPRPPIETHKGSLFEFSLLNIDDLKALRTLSQEYDSTIFITLLAAFHVFLYRYTGQNDFIIGVPVSGRNHPMLDTLIGCFINTLALRTTSEGQETFQDFLKWMRNECFEAFKNQDAPFEKVVEKLTIERSLSHSLLFQVMFNMLPQMEVNSIADIQLRFKNIDRKKAHLDLSLTVQESDTGLLATFEYNTDIFLKSSIKQMANHFQRLLKAVIENPEYAIGKLPLLSASETQRQLVQWNKNPITYPKKHSFLKLIEAWSERSPEAIAIICKGKKHSYHEINTAANRIAHSLIDAGIKPEDKVVVCLERSAEFISIILGILKAGGAYVPLDPAAPKSRTETIINDLKPFCILTDRLLKSKFSGFDVNILSIDKLSNVKSHNPCIPIQKDQLSYIIYTSGSTADPKGVEIEYGCINDRIIWKNAAHPLKHGDTMLHTYSFIFDGSIVNYFWPLCAGASLLIASEQELIDPISLIKLIKNYKVTTMDLLPSLLQELLEVEEISNCRSIKTVFSGGEALPGEMIHKFYERCTATLHNTYGPTEATVEASAWKCTPNFNGSIAPIGKAIAGAKLYVLDQNQNLAPIGVPGELYIGGIGLARGYLNSPDLTSKKFIQSIFSKNPKERLYRTGDLVKYRRDGNIEFLGRLDSQIKIRGFRIDLREIEAALENLNFVKKAVVIAKGNGLHKLLAAYIILDTTVVESDFNKIIKNALKKTLPSYMIPQQIIFLKNFPTLLNGKINYKALPEPDRNIQLTRKKTSISKAEAQILSIWKEVLDYENITVFDNFFEVGGNSLLAMRLIIKINNKLGLAIPLIHLFKYPTVEEFAQSLNTTEIKNESNQFVLMGGDGDKKPFFGIHPVGGNILCYRALAKYWEEDRPFYAIQSTGLEEDELPQDSIEKMASSYIKAMKQIQSSGPYLLGGWSFGGLIAAEMANQLKNQGDEIALLVLIDTTANIDKFKTINLDDDSTLLSELTQHFNVNQKAKKLNLSFKEQIARFIENGGVKARNKSSATLDRLVNLAKANYRALQGFSIPNIDAKVALIRTAANREKAKTLGWNKYATNLKIFHAPGDHWAITQDEQAQHYAKIMKHCFDSLITEEAPSKIEF